jgi:hypothetical protein
MMRLNTYIYYIEHTYIIKFVVSNTNKYIMEKVGIDK